MHRSPRRGIRAGIITAALATTAALGCASSALADTTVSIEPNGTAKRLFVRDTTSLFDERMETTVTRVDGRLKITDAVGNMHAGAGCFVQGAAALCSDSGVNLVLMQGGNKNDVLFNDTNLPGALRGGKGDDRLEGGEADDRLNGEAGTDDEFGGDGNDDFVFEPGRDTLNGQNGTADRVSYETASSGASIQLDGGTGTVVGETDNLAFMERAIGTPFADSIDGNNVNNTLSGLAGMDTIRGLGANDVLNGGNDADSLAGNDGIDVADYRERSGGVRVSLDDQANDGSALDGNSKDNVRSDVENVRGGNGSDTLVGQASAATANTLEGNNGNDTLDGGPGPDKLSGGANTDRADYSARGTEDIVVSLDSLTINDDGGVSDDAAGRRDDVFGVENVTTAAGADILKGNSLGNVFDTGPGDDHLFGFDGNDTLRPGLGVDEVIGGRDLDTLETTDGQADQPISCGEGSSTSPDDPRDKIDGDVADLLANPGIGILDDPAECEDRILH